MINLFDNYNEQVKDLHLTLIASGYNHQTVVLEDDGYLPDDVISPYSYFLGEEDKTSLPKYFNQVAIPKFWEIIGDNNSAYVQNLADKKAYIRYSEPTSNRLVKQVEWLDRKGIVRIIERYNKYGRIFSTTTTNKDGIPIVTTYYNIKGENIIEENHIAQSIILNYNNSILMFENKLQFIKYFLKVSNLDLDSIFIPSLAMPFLVSYSLPQESGKDILFWQEPIYDEIPGNMKLILENDLRVKKIVVQDRDAYLRLYELCNEHYREKIVHLGMLYDYKRNNNYQRNALILTNSDQLEQIDTLIISLPNIHFNIAAITEMSPKLMELIKYNNVTVHPNISKKKVEELFRTCDIYFDINYHNEILSALRLAFENNMLIVAFNSTIHNTKYVARENRYDGTEVEKMITKVKAVFENKEYMDKLLAAQRFEAGQDSVENYNLLTR